MNNYNLLIQRLDKFIRKYYINKFLRGLLYTIGIVLLLYLVFVVFEYFNYSGSALRRAMLWSFIGISASAVLFFILLPLLNYFSLGKIISHEQAASIIGTHFTDVQDKLLNILQLKKQTEQTSTSNALIYASIDQKISKLKPIPFQSAIDLSKNKKYLKYALPPLAIFLIMLFAAPNIINEGTQRLLNPDKVYEKKAPFKFVVKNKDMQVMQYQDFTLEVFTEGLITPNEIFVEQDGYTYKMTKDKEGNFTYTFNKLQKNTKFLLKSGEYNSHEYTISVVPKPAILNFKGHIDYPEYIGKPDEDLNYLGDMTLPQGTIVSWDFETIHADNLKILFDSISVQLIKENDQEYTLTRRFMKNASYSVQVTSALVQNTDNASYYVNIIPDQFPSITVEQFNDSLSYGNFWYYGDAADDYGLRNINLVYRIEGAGANTTRTKAVPMTVTGNAAIFSYTVNAIELGIQPGQQLIYYFEVYDNDGVNGNKSSRTQLFSYKQPSLDEIEKQNEQQSEEIKMDIEKFIKEAEALQQEFKAMQQMIIEKKNLSYDEKKQIQNLLERQKNFQQQMEQLQDKFNQNIEQQEEFKDNTESIKEKQEKLQELFEKTMDNELQELMKKMEELLEKMNKDQALENMNEMKMSNEALEKELDQMLELFKKMELEQKIQETVEKLEELAKKEEELGDKTESGEKSSEESKKEQEEIKKEFEEIKKDMQDIEKKNAEQGNKNDNKMENAKKEAEQAEKNMEKAQEKLDQNDTKKASENQKNAAENMKQMANNMQQMMNKKQQQEMEMNMKALRQILENLVKTSFDQETLMNKVLSTNINTPAYVSNMSDQQRIKDNYKIIEDSLNALAKRVFEIGPIINDELELINKHMTKGIDNLEARRTQVAATEQQYVMTSLNNLALLLSEVMQSMQNQMKQQMQGNGSCNNPGGTGSGMSELAKMQQQLKDKMTEMSKQDGGKKDGGQQSGGSQGNSKEIAQMAAKQAAIKNALKNLNANENKNGKGKYGDLSKIIDEMEKTEEQLVNKKITNEMLQRQQEIITKLLEAEKANRQQEQDDQRKSDIGAEKPKTMPVALQDYIKKRQAEIDQYRKIPPSLTPYYKKIVEQYFKRVGGQ